MRFTEATAKKTSTGVEVTVELAVIDPTVDFRETNFDWRAASHIATAAGYDVGKCHNNELIIKNGEKGVFKFVLKAKAPKKPKVEKKVPQLEVKKEEKNKGKAKGKYGE